MSTVHTDATTRTEPVPFSPAWYAVPQPESRYSRVMGAVVNGAIGSVAAVLTGRRS